MSLLYRAGALLIKTGLGLVRATEDCLAACCRPFYCCTIGGDVSSFCTQDECPPGAARTGPFATQQECETYCGGGGPQIRYCCWDDDFYSSSSCSEFPCPEGFERSGPYNSPSECQKNCNSGACCPNPESESPYCFQATEQECEDAGGTFALNQACYQTPCPTDCYGQGTPSPCPGSVFPPADGCSAGLMNCAPSVTATITITGVQCVKNSSGICIGPSQALADACNNTFILDSPGNACWVTTYFPFVIGGLNYLINLYIVPSIPASPPAAANTICYKVYFALISANFGPCSGTGGQSAESADHCGVAPVSHILNCDCSVWQNCDFTASGSLTETFGSCYTSMVDLSNAQFSLVIA